MKSPSRTDRGSDAGGVAAPVWDGGRRVSAHRDSGYVTHDDVDTLRTLLRSRYAVGMLIPGTRDAVRPLHGEAGFDPMGRVADGRVAGHTAIPPTRRFTRADSSRAFASHAHALGMLRADSVPYATLDGICTPPGSGRWILAHAFRSYAPCASPPIL